MIADQPTVDGDLATVTLHIITGLQTGGAERMLVNYLTHPKRAGDPVCVVALTGRGRMAGALRADGIDVLELDLTLRPDRLLGGLLRLRRLIRTWRPATIAGWMYHANLFALAALLLSGRRRSTRLVWHIRCSSMPTRHYRWSFSAVVALSRRAARLADQVVYNAHRGFDDHRRLGFPAARSIVVTNGIDTARFHPDEAARQAVRSALGIAAQTTVLIAVARCDVMKGYDILVEAIATLDPDVVTLAVGRGTDTALPNRPGLRRLGERTDVAALMAAADIFVSASRFGEGFSNVLGEAMAVGLTPVATDVGDGARIVGDAGFIVPSEDAAALAEALARAIDWRSRAPDAAAAQARGRIVGSFDLDGAVANLDRVHRAEVGPG